MDSSKTFDLFPTLPTELRLKVFSDALPNRILQLGYDFPFPFLQEPHKDSSIPPSTPHDQTLSPVCVSLPALFHTCHESRQLCLSIYIQFAYTYAHPHNDTLYISSNAAPMLHQSMNWYYKCARPPLYPLAELDKVAVEFDWLDLPLTARETGGWIIADNRKLLFSSTLLENYLVAFAEFGLPKKLLLVGGTGNYGNRAISISLRGWAKIEFTEDPNRYEPRRSEAILQYIHDNWYYKREDIPWFRQRLPDVRTVGVDKSGERLKPDVGDSLLKLGDEVAREWQNHEYAIHGRDWDFSLDRSPYDKDNMERALARAMSLGNNVGPSGK